MSVLIKGMEMPDRCFACPMCIKEDGEWLCNISHGSYLEYMEIPEDIAIDTRPDWCPLVEVYFWGKEFIDQKSDTGDEKIAEMGTE